MKINIIISRVSLLSMVILLGTVPFPVNGDILSFQDGIEPTVSYAGTRDTSLSENQPDTAFGDSVELFIDGDDPSGSGNDVSALLRWDISDDSSWKYH